MERGRDSPECRPGRGRVDTDTPAFRHGGRVVDLTSDEVKLNHRRFRFLPNHASGPLSLLILVSQAVVLGVFIHQRVWDFVPWIAGMVGLAYLWGRFDEPLYVLDNRRGLVRSWRNFFGIELRTTVCRQDEATSIRVHCHGTRARFGSFTHLQLLLLRRSGRAEVVYEAHHGSPLGPAPGTDPSAEQWLADLNDNARALADHLGVRCWPLSRADYFREMEA